MKKVYSGFLGDRPLLDPMLLPSSNSTRAVNLRLHRGDLEPLKAPLFYRKASKPNDQLSLYRFGAVPGDPDSGFIFSWPFDVDCVPGPVPDNSQDLAYWTGDGYPRYTDNSIATGPGALPNGSYQLGVPAADYGPYATLIFKDSGTIPEFDESTVTERDYVLTFLQQLGELQMEGPPSDPSNIVGVPAGEGWGCKVINLALPPSGPYPWIGKRLYRRIYSGGATRFALVAELPVAQAEYEDVTPDAEIPGDELVSTLWDAPPVDLHSLGVLTNGIMFGARENDVCLSEPYLPHAWSPFARYPLPYKIVGMGQADNNIIAITQHNPYIVTGINPGAMSVTELKMDQGCLAKRSIVSGSFGCCFASPDGMILIAGQGSRNLTEGLFTRDQWLALNPPSMLSAANENLLIVTFTRKDGSQGTLMLAPGNPESGVIWTSQRFTAAYQDGLLDSLMVYDPEQEAVCLWDEGAYLSLTWRSRLEVLPVPSCFTAVRVEADSYDDLKFRIYVDDRLKHETGITDNEPFRLPGGYLARKAQFELSGTNRVRKLVVAEVPSELE